jgi:histidine ammonia-lyase
MSATDAVKLVDLVENVEAAAFALLTAANAAKALGQADQSARLKALAGRVGGQVTAAQRDALMRLRTKAYPWGGDEGG